MNWLSRREFLGLLFPISLLACTVFLWLARHDAKPGEPHTRAMQPITSTPEQKDVADTVPVTNAADAASQVEFGKWLATRMERTAAGGPQPDATALIAEGAKLAEARRNRMARLIRENPQQALAEALSYSEWESLPPEIQALVEKPFTIVADYQFYPVCGNGGFLPPGTPSHIAELSLPDGSSLEAFAFGQRIGHMSKRRLPVQGISLDGIAALREETLQPVHAADLASLARSLPNGNDIIGEGPVHAVAGGRLFAFESVEELNAANERLALADARPGPVAASSFLLPLGDGEIDWNQLETFASEQATAWTETKKKLFLIRINFTDAPTEPVTQAAAATVLNGVVSDSIRQQSYQKTWIEAGVSAGLYTMPKTAAYYANGGSNFNSELLRDARNTFRTNKSGADSAIDIGPVSNTEYGDGGGLGVYDIVGVTFENIGMVSGGIRYAGLAGGGNLWMQDSNSSGVYIHELGHNYGLGHASSWNVASSNPADPAGASDEYGDIFDIMGSGPDPEGHFHSQAKQRLSWLTASQWQDASALGSNTYRIHRIDDTNTTSTHSRGVRITKVGAPAEYYWLSYRPAFVNNVTQMRGVYLNWQRSGQTRCWLLDTTPNSTGGKNDSSITLGRTYSDTAANVHITTLSTGGTGADQWVDVRVNLGPFPGNAAPAANPIAGPASVPARSAATFTGNASDSNSDTLAWHWNTKDGLVKDNSASMTHAWVVGGNYTLDLTVSDMKGGTDTESKMVTVTDPLDTWTQQTSGSTGYLHASAWGKGRFVVAEYWGSILTSWDGVTWTNNGTLPDFDGDPRMAYGNNVFVVIGKKDGAAASQICYSYDARTWNVAAFPAGVPQMRDVIFANGRFLAAGDGGNILASSDGITWALTTVSGAPDFQRLAWSGSVWLAMADNASSGITETAWTSANGTAWSQQANLGFSVDSVLGDDGVLYATGWYGGITYSTDHGITWKTAQTPGSSRWSTDQIAVADDGTMLVCAMAMDENGQPQALLVSTDGTQWHRSTAGTNFAYDVNSLVFGFGRFLATSDGGVIRTSGSHYPNNTAPVATITLAPATTPARENRLFAGSATDADGDSLTYTWDFGLPALIADGSNLVKSFDFGGTYTATFRVSDNKGGLTTLTRNITVTDPARSWTQRTSGTSNALNAIAANGNLAVAVGGSGGVIRTSPDGVTWTARTVSSSTNITFRGAVWDGSQFVIVGEDYNSTATAGWQGVIYTSPDGTAWTRRYGGGTQRNNELQAVAAGGGGLVAVGDIGTILESVNGTTWNPVTVSALSSTILKGVAFGSGTWLISGHSMGGSGTAKVFSSTNRTQWMDQTAGAGFDPSWQDFRKIAWLNNRFVGSGWYSKVRVSTDLGATFTTTRSDSEETPGLAYGDNIYFAAGINRNASSADIDLLSLDGTTWTRSAAPTTDNRNGAVFFKHTFITVGENGSIWQSADVTPGGSTPNTPPVFAGYATSTPYLTPIAIPLATLLGYASDTDGDVILVTSAGDSTQGGTAALQASSVLYTPPTSYTGADSFPITLTDARGATTSGTVAITITSTDDPTLATPPTIAFLPDNVSLKVDFTGLPNASYQIQRSINLSGWTTLITITASPAGAVSYTDPAPPPDRAFYRIRKP